MKIIRLTRVNPAMEYPQIYILWWITTSLVNIELQRVKSKCIGIFYYKSKFRFSFEMSFDEKSKLIYDSIAYGKGDLVQHHLINMVNYGNYNDTLDAIILTPTGPSLAKSETWQQLRKQSGNEHDWPKISIIMTHLVAYFNASFKSVKVPKTKLIYFLFWISWTLWSISIVRTLSILIFGM